MEQEEFKKLYADVEQKLGERFWLIPRDRAMFVLGACTVFLALTVGTSWLAARAAVSGTAAAQATRRIQSLEQEAQAATARISKTDAQFFLTTLDENAQIVADIAWLYTPDPKHTDPARGTNDQERKEKRENAAAVEGKRKLALEVRRRLDDRMRAGTAVKQTGVTQ